MNSRAFLLLPALALAVVAALAVGERGDAATATTLPAAVAVTAPLQQEGGAQERATPPDGGQADEDRRPEGEREGHDKADKKNCEGKWKKGGDGGAERTSTTAT